MIIQGMILSSTRETLQVEVNITHSFIEENGFSNMVSDGGNGITIDKKLISLEPLNRDLALTLIEEEMRQKRIPFSLALDNTPTLYTYKELPYYHPASRDTILLDTFREVEEICKIFVKANELEEKNKSNSNS